MLQDCTCLGMYYSRYRSLARGLHNTQLTSKYDKILKTTKMMLMIIMIMIMRVIFNNDSNYYKNIIII